MQRGRKQQSWLSNKNAHLGAPQTGARFPNYAECFNILRGLSRARRECSAALLQASSRDIDGASNCFARGEALPASMVRLSTPDAELMEVLKQPVEIRNPQDQDHDDQAV